MEPVNCFFVERLNVYTWTLSLYGEAACPKRSQEGCIRTHHAEVVLDQLPKGHSPGYPPDGDPLWPTKCDFCGEPMVRASGNGSLGGSPHYRRVDTGEIFVGKLPVGAMLYDDEDNGHPGPDGKSLIVVCPGPGGQWWYVDSRASNCTVPCKCGKLYSDHCQSTALPNCKNFDPVDGGKHRCWIRHGVPPLVHVDKNGDTCQAGAGSIQVTGWHGFLSHGRLQEQR